MAMTLRLTEHEQENLKALAVDQGVSMQDAARQAIREYIIRSEHRARVGRAADVIMSVHAEAIDRLGQ